MVMRFHAQELVNFIHLRSSMNIKHSASTVAFATLVAFSGLGVNLQNASLQPQQAIAQTTNCNEVRPVTPFSAAAAPEGVNVRSSPNIRPDNIIGALGPNESRVFNAYTYGDAVNDIWLSQPGSPVPDARWYKLQDQIQGQDGWVASGVVYGNPNPSPPRLCSSSGGQVDMEGLKKLLFGNTPVSVTGRYGQSLQIWCRFYRGCMHPALDFAPNSGRIGDPIYSPVDGVVIARNDFFGIVAVYNQKANITFFFNHMNSATVSVNSTVTKGQQVGTIGTKGFSTGPHLHFEARLGRQTYVATDINQTMNPVDAVNLANQ